VGSAVTPSTDEEIHNAAGMLYVLTRTLAGGRGEGILSSLGTFVGGMVHVVAAAGGLSVVLATSALAFSLVKFAGAAYLVFLGLRMLLFAERESSVDVTAVPPRHSPFIQGIWTEVLNPKTALFFLAFIPQFVSRQGSHVFIAFLVLGTISVVLNTSGDICAVLLASPLQMLFKRSRRAQVNQRRASGAVMVALGTYVALSDSR